MKTILLVDDNEGHRNVTQKFLEIKDFKVITANNGLDAMYNLKTHPNYDLIISDMEMPVMNGLEFLIKAKQNPVFQKIPFIVLSSVGRQAEIDKIMKLGASAYIIKPFTAATFNKTLKEVGF